MIDKNLKKELSGLSKNIFDKLRKGMVSKHNPKFNEVFGNTPLANMSYAERMAIPKAMQDFYFKKLKSFRGAWLDVFGSREAKLLRRSPNEYVDEFFKDVRKDGKKAISHTYSKNWLRKKFIEEQKERKNKVTGG
tara:strand:+ start:1775 stop:2179 length:405 start_codon:yes stop_codon:yes gene_type:complete